jgi:hypothetical protein
MKSLILLVILSVFFIGCGNAPTTNNAVASPGANVAKANVDNPVAVTTPTPATTTNDGPTLSPVYQAFCAAFAKKDDAAIRKAWSAETLKGFEEDMKAENIKSLAKLLEDDDPKGKCSVKNEVITGEKAVGEIVSGAYPNGFKVLFVKENGEWKMTNQSPTFDSMRPAANTAK